MKLNAANMPLLSFRAKFHCASREDTIALGRSFSAVLALSNRDLTMNPVRSVGLVAAPGTGKTSFASGIHDGLGDTYKQGGTAQLRLKGVNDNVSEKGGLVRHFDLCVSPYHKYYALAIGPHHKTLAQGLDKAGVELVEHANVYKSPRFDYVVRLLAQNGNSRTVNVYASDEMAAEPAFQTFLNENESRRAKPHHYALDIIHSLCPNPSA